MEFRYKSREGAIYIHKISQLEDSWKKEKDGIETKIPEAVYVSRDKFKSLSKEFFMSVDDNQTMKLEDKIDFIKEASSENFTNVGGVIIYFIPKGEKHQIYCSSIIKQVKKIE